MKQSTWFNKLGFKTNPLSIKPQAGELIGNEEVVESVIEKVREGGIILIEGEYGSGKTTLLKRIIKEFRGKYRIIYYSCNRKNASINYDRMLIRAGNFFQRMFRIRKKNNILLLDEAQDMNIKDKMLLPKYFDEGFFHAVVLAIATNSDKPDFSEGEISERIGDNRFKLKSLTDEQAIALIRKRLGNISMINEETIKKVFRRSGNPRQFLEDMEDLLRYAIENNIEKIKDEDVESVLEKDKPTSKIENE